MIFGCYAFRIEKISILYRCNIITIEIVDTQYINDSRFDLDLRRRLVKNKDELAQCVDVFLNIRDDQGIVSTVYLNGASARKTLGDNSQDSLVRAATGCRCAAAA